MSQPGVRSAFQASHATPWWSSSELARGVCQGFFQWLPVVPQCLNRATDQLVDSSLSSPCFLFPLPLDVFLAGLFASSPTFWVAKEGAIQTFKMDKTRNCHYWQEWCLCILIDLDYSAFPSASLSSLAVGNKQMGESGFQLPRCLLLSLNCYPWVTTVMVIPLGSLCLTNTSWFLSSPAKALASFPVFAISVLGVGN